MPSQRRDGYRSLLSTHISVASSKCCICSPLVSPILGGDQSSKFPKIGDLGGLDRWQATSQTTDVYLLSPKMGEEGQNLKGACSRLAIA